MRTLLLAIVLTIPLATSTAGADVLVETDPSTFVLSGWSAHVRIGPAETPRWTFGAGAYALDLPSPIVDLASENRGRDWDARIRFAYGAFVDRYFGPGRRGAFVGLQLALHHLGAERPGEPMVHFVDALAMPRVGYTWFPFANGFYLLGWFGVGATTPIAGDPRDYVVFPVIAFGAVHVGWRL
jgi:hypothetical protein